MSVNGLNQYTHTGKLRVNLLQAELLPETALLTLPRVVIVWCIVFFVMVIWAIQTHYTQSTLKKNQMILKQTNAQYTEQLNVLTTQLAARHVDTLLTEKLNNLKLLMNNRQALHGKLTNPNKTYVLGFSSAMDDLAILHHQDIRLEVIDINNDNMTFSGLAFTPEAVPAWLAGFESSTLLSGKSFSHFKLSENEQGITEFIVSSKVKEATINE
jgi:hypothetical protein